MADSVAGFPVEEGHPAEGTVSLVEEIRLRRPRLVEMGEGRANFLAVVAPDHREDEAGRGSWAACSER